MGEQLVGVLQRRQGLGKGCVSSANSWYQKGGSLVWCNRQLVTPVARDARLMAGHARRHGAEVGMVDTDGMDIVDPAPAQKTKTKMMQCM